MWPHWPQWQSDVSAAETDGPLQPGTAIAWTAGGTSIHARLAAVRPLEQIAWTGKAYQATAIHVWTLGRISAEETEVTTTESMDGFLLTLFYSSKQLSEADRRWLDRLKTRAEQEGTGVR